MIQLGNKMFVSCIRAVCLTARADYALDARKIEANDLMVKPPTPEA